MGRLGKIDRSSLENLMIKNAGFANPNVVQGPQFGVDTAVVKLNDTQALVMASDPTSLIPTIGIKESAWLSVVLTANDVATSGFLPQYAQFVFNLPASMSNDSLQEYWNYIHQFCAEMGIAITGGHTGFDQVTNTTISGGVTMFAQVELAQAKTTAQVKPGQDIIATKSAALTSSAILAKSFPEHVRKHLGAEVQHSLAQSFYQTSVLSEVQALRQQPEMLAKISALHDVTEGGVLGTIYEMCAAGGVGVLVQQNQIPLGNEQKALCGLFQLDPFRCVGTGSLVLACDPAASAEIVKLLQDAGISAAVVGRTLAENTKSVVQNGQKEALEYAEEDPYWGVFAQSMQAGLK
ncbi:MAG: AIR synthase [Fibrobacter sp.]|nr:AIR synthase [Fibrobacter sp.]